MFYIIETVYTGPNQTQDQFVDADTIEIGTEPARGNCSGEIILNGWCGTTNDWAVYAHGEYETVEEAEDAVKRIFGPVHEEDANGDAFENRDESVVKVFKQGEYEPMSKEAAGNWLAAAIYEDIDATTSDDRIQELVEEYEGLANDEGYTIDSGDLQDLLEKRRQDLFEALPDYMQVDLGAVEFEVPNYDFNSLGSIERAAQRVNDGPVQGFEHLTPEYLAAAYALQASQLEASDPLWQADLEVHLEFLIEAGAQFDWDEAIARATGQLVDFMNSSYPLAVIRQYMDSDIEEYLDGKLPYCHGQQFLNCYQACHLAEHRDELEIE